MRFMQKKILTQLINIDKVAYKEVNFKSKLIEWSQKNRVRVDFKMLEQTKDENGSPVFHYQVMIEGLEGSAGKGFSKKESQQLASKLTLDRLRKEPQFIDSVFVAKATRTQQEEEPVESVPDTEVKSEFIIQQEVVIEENTAVTVTEAITPVKSPEIKSDKKVNDEFDLSDISTMPKEELKEDIIAAAEAAAFSEQ